jgi:hypothetical protein
MASLNIKNSVPTNEYFRQDRDVKYLDATGTAKGI